jgi:uncharacterized protein YkwD
MKQRFLKAFSGIIAAAMIAGTSMTAYAAYDPFAAMEAKTRQLVAAAIAEGRVPPGTTIYDCAYSKDANGNTIIVQYMDGSGAWIDLSTGKPNPPQAVAPAAPAKTAQMLTEEALAEYEAEVFALVNEAREQEGLAPLEREDSLDEAAEARAEELSRKFSHTRPDGTGFHTIMGVDENYNYAENGGSSGENPADQMEGWMNSDGHRTNILDSNGKGYTHIGVGVYQADNGKMYWCQIFYRPI